MAIVQTICVDLLGYLISLRTKRKEAIIFGDEIVMVKRNPLNETLQFHVIRFHPCKKTTINIQTNL